MKPIHLFTAPFVVTGALLFACATIGHTAEDSAPKLTGPAKDEAIAFFENKVRPVLISRCFSCHGEANQKNGLRLDTREAMLKGGGRGAAIVPGKPEQSLLVQTINHAGELKMPPGGEKLRPDEIADITTWIKQGAFWPEAKTAPNRDPLSPEKRNFWSLRPVKKPAIPVSSFPANVKRVGAKASSKAVPSPYATLWKTWVKNPIDAFILSKLETKGLKPAPAADKRMLIRRATYDLIGLPPTPEEVEAFVADNSPNAYEKLIDRLLASPHYGERWGRHWLDVARYADSNGLDENTAFGNAWHYRDYVVNAFNQDKPYDQFLREQIAGDLMPTDDEKIRNERLTATGFLSLGAKVLAEPDKAKMVMDIVDEQIEVVTKTVMGLTVACARCHDHKFDPITTKDYYALAGIFKSTRTMETLNTVARILERPLSSKELDEQIKLHNEKVTKLQGEVSAIRDRNNQPILASLKRDGAKYLRAGWEYLQQPEQGSLADTLARPGETRLIVEAEKFDRGNLARDFQTYGQGIGVIHNVGTPDVAEWDITVPAAGMYQVELRYASAEMRPVKLSLNGKIIKEQTAGQVTGSFQPEGQKWEVQGVFAFEAGKNTLRIDSNNAIPHFDKLLIASAPKQTERQKPILTLEQIAQKSSLLPEVVKLWKTVLAKGENSPIFYPFVKLAEKLEATPDQPATLTLGKDLVINPAVRAAIDEVSFRSIDELAERYGKLFMEANPNDADRKALYAALYDKGGILALPEKPESYYTEAERDTLKKAEEVVKTAQASAPKVPMTPAVEEAKKIENCRVHIRGNTQTLGDEVPRRFLTVLGDTRTKSVNESQSGRMELAQWLTQPTHPLTARVAVNRIWQHHFGQGFVRTPDNWGLLGERPTHPELLDWLAATFVAKDEGGRMKEGKYASTSSLILPPSSMNCGWSIKKLHKLIMLSNTYQMSSAENADAALKDPDNRLYWRVNRQRLEAEPFRDALLTVSGKLDRTLGGSLLTTGNFDYVTNDQSSNAAQYGQPRRSIYMPVIRNAVYDVFQAFDFGDPSMVNAKRASTTVAPQALFVLNSPLVLDLAKSWAANLLKRTGTDDNGRIRYAYTQAYARPAQPTEIQRALGYIARYSARFAASEPDETKRREKAWASLCHILLASNEFIYLN